MSEAAVQLTLTGTTVGFALGQLVVGPFSDKFGRRLPLILATAVHIASSVGAALSTDIATLGLFRVLMGIGAAGGGVVAMAMVRDLFTGYAMVRMFSRMALVNGLAPDPGARHRIPAAAGHAVARHLRVPGLLRHAGDHCRDVPGPRDPAAREARPVRDDGPAAVQSPLLRPDLRRPADGRRHELRRPVYLPVRLAVPVPGHLRFHAAAVRPAVRHQFAGHRGRRPDQLPAHPAGPAAVDPGLFHRLDVPDGRR